MNPDDKGGPSHSKADEISDGKAASGKCKCCRSAIRSINKFAEHLMGASSSSQPASDAKRGDIELHEVGRRPHYLPEHGHAFKTLDYRDGICHLIAAFTTRGLLILPHAIQKAGLISSFIIISSLWICYPYLIHSLMVVKRRVETERGVRYLSYTGLLYSTLQTGPSCCKSIAKEAKSLTMVFYLLYHLMKCSTIIRDINIFVTRLSGVDQKDRYERNDFKLLFVIPVLLMTFFIKSFKSLTYAANIAVICNGICLLLLLSFLFSFAFNSMSFKNVTLIGSFEDIMQLIVLSTYSLEPLGVYIAVEKNLKERKLFYGFTGVLAHANCIVLWAIIFLSVSGSLVPNQVKDDDASFSQRIKILYFSISSIGMLFTYPLFYFVCIEIFWETVSNYEAYKLTKSILRITVNILIVISSIALPIIDDVTFVMSAFLIPFLCILVPEIIEMIFDHSHRHKSKLTILKHVFIICLLVFTMTAKIVFVIINDFTEPIYDEH